MSIQTKLRPYESITALLAVIAIVASFTGRPGPQGAHGLRGDPGPQGDPGQLSQTTLEEINRAGIERLAASVCLSRANSKWREIGIQVVRFEGVETDLNAACVRAINKDWTSPGIVKANFINHKCDDIENKFSGFGEESKSVFGQLSFVSAAHFMERRRKQPETERNWQSCTPSNTFICCAPKAFLDKYP